MNVSTAMTPNAECLRPDSTLTEAGELMRRMDIGAMPICGADNRLAGMLTDRDIVVRAIAIGKDPKTTHAEEVMTPDICYCFQDQPLEDAAELMKKEKVRRLAVLDRDKRLVGMLSLGDVSVKGGDEQLGGEALEEVSAPAAPLR